jgi:hypothetical protein
MYLVVALEGQRQLAHRLFQQAAVRAQLVGGDRFELDVEGGVQDRRVAGAGRAGLGRQRVTPGQQRDRGAGQQQAGPAQEHAARVRSGAARLDQE